MKIILTCSLRCIIRFPLIAIITRKLYYPTVLKSNTNIFQEGLCMINPYINRNLYIFFQARDQHLVENSHSELNTGEYYSMWNLECYLRNDSNFGVYYTSITWFRSVYPCFYLFVEPIPSQVIQKYLAFPNLKLTNQS